MKFLLGAFFFHVRRFFISYVIIYLRCHSSPPDALCLPFRYFFFFSLFVVLRVVAVH